MVSFADYRLNYFSYNPVQITSTFGGMGAGGALVRFTI